MPGPLPSPNPVRRNAPTISTTILPRGGRLDPVPDLPSWRRLGKAGSAWWAWAWATPQAAAWVAGFEDFVARRAQLEDDLRTLDNAPEIDLVELLGMDDGREMQLVTAIIQRLHSLAGGRLQVMKEMRELDNRLGLNPKALADLRWSISPDEVGAQREQPKSAGKAEKARRLKAV